MSDCSVCREGEGSIYVGDWQVYIFFLKSTLYALDSLFGQVRFVALSFSLLELLVLRLFLFSSLRLDAELDQKCLCAGAA